MVSLVNYYFRRSKKGIIRRSTKRRKIEGPPSEETPRRSVVWNLTKTNPQKEAGETLYELSAFVGSNIVSVNDLNALSESY